MLWVLLLLAGASGVILALLWVLSRLVLVGISDRRTNGWPATWAFVVLALLSGIAIACTALTFVAVIERG